MSAPRPRPADPSREEEEEEAKAGCSFGVQGFTPGCSSSPGAPFHAGYFYPVPDGSVQASKLPDFPLPVPSHGNLRLALPARMSQKLLKGL